MKEESVKENIARVKGMSLPISTKQAIEICNFIRGRKIEDAKKLLEGVIEQKAIMPFKRFNKGVGHKRKTGPGRYPKKASREIIRLLESVNANAQFKGLNTSNLTIIKIVTNKAGASWHFGRKRRRKMKRTNIEIIAEEGKRKEAKEKSEEARVKKTEEKKQINDKK